MTMRAYLDPRQLKTTEELARFGGGGDVRIGGASCSTDGDGNVYWESDLDPIHVQVPVAIQSRAVRYGIRVHFDASPTRKRGVYRDGTATATLDRKGADRYLLEISATQLLDAVRLYERIRAGTCAPNQSWDE